MTTPRRLKNAGHSGFNELVRQDWVKTIKLHPERFDALLYKPVELTQSEEAEDGQEVALFGDMNDHQENIQYLDPINAICIEAPNDDPFNLAMWDGDDSLGEGESGILLLRTDIHDIPQGSVFEFEEELSEGGARRCWWYVHRSQATGTSTVGAMHVCIPCRDMEPLKPTPVTNP